MDLKNTKGQSDTFKLLIAAVVALAILAIVAAVLASIDPSQLDCVGNPITDLTTTISQARSGIERSSGTICLQPGESFTSSALVSKLSGVSPIEFVCYENSVICSGDNKKLDVATDRITAKDRAQFTGLVKCEKQASGDDSCTVQVRAPL